MAVWIALVGLAIALALYLRAERVATRSLIARQGAKIVELTDELAALLRSTMIAAGAAERAAQLPPEPPGPATRQLPGAARPAASAPALPSVERRVVSVTRDDNPVHTRETVEAPPPATDHEEPPSTKPSTSRRRLAEALLGDPTPDEQALRQARIRKPAVDYDAAPEEPESETPDQNPHASRGGRGRARAGPRPR